VLNLGGWGKSERFGTPGNFGKLVEHIALEQGPLIRELTNGLKDSLDFIQNFFTIKKTSIRINIKNTG